MKSHQTRPFQLALAVVALAAAAFAGSRLDAQASGSSLVGSWRADTPLADGVLQTFRFEPNGTFHLTMAVAVDGQYRVEGDRLIETVAAPGTGVVKTDTSSIRLNGDSLTVSNPAHPQGASKTLHRSGPAASGAQSILGNWTIVLGGGMTASYQFEANGTMRVRAQVSDEGGTYTVNGNTVEFSNDHTFQVPAAATFSIRDGVLTLTPPNGGGARTFHHVEG